MLTGSALLAKVKELGDVSKSDLVRACGYVSTKKDGDERLNFTAFYEALLEAKGVSLGAGGGKGVGTPGRKLSYIATVQGNGNLLVGKAYTNQLCLEPGDKIEIKLGRKQITLVPLDTLRDKPHLAPSLDTSGNALVNPGSLRKFIAEIVLRDQHPLGEEAMDSAIQHTMGAIAAGTIASPKEAALCASALLLAGVKEATQEGSGYVSPLHVEAGWEKHLRYCPGNLPPDECMLRSIVERVNVLSKDLPGFDHAIRIIAEKDGDWSFT